MTLLLWGMVVALLIPIGLLCRNGSVWDRLAAFGSIGTKVAMLAMVVARIMSASAFARELSTVR